MHLQLFGIWISGGHITCNSVQKIQIMTSLFPSNQLNGFASFLKLLSEVCELYYEHTDNKVLSTKAFTADTTA